MSATLFLHKTINPAGGGMVDSVIEVRKKEEGFKQDTVRACSARRRVVLQRQPQIIQRKTRAGADCHEIQAVRLRIWSEKLYFR